MNKRGQSIIEYALIAVLVIFGIVVMGPYVLRSINAHFKLWDEGVKDSFDENIKQAPLSDIPPINVNCSCQNQPGQCGSSLATSQCAGNQRIINHTCNPQGCDRAPSSTCQYDTTCCTNYSKVGCGTIPTGQSLPTDNSNCYYGQAIMATQCSTLPIKCVADPNCDASCLGVISTNFEQCPNGPPQTGLLDQNYFITELTNVTGCQNGQPCQYYCTLGFCPAHSIANTGVWGNFLNGGAIWAAPDWTAGTHDFVGQVSTYSRIIDIPAGTYIIRFSSTPYGYVYIDGKKVFTDYTNSTSQGYQDTPYALTSGFHTIVLGVTNKNVATPAGVAMQILKSDGITPLTPPIDTFGVNASQWNSNVLCSSGQYWDCANSTCDIGSAPNPYTCQNNPPCSSLDGTFYGTYQTSGNSITLSMTCSNSILGGFCLNNYSGNRGSDKTYSCAATNPNSKSIYCNWSGNEVIYSQECGLPDTFTCINNQLVGIWIGSYTPPISGCNWTGTQSFDDYGAHNDLLITCSAGKISHLQFASGGGGNNCPSPK